jgi:hypothetical protein
VISQAATAQPTAAAEFAAARCPARLDRQHRPLAVAAFQPARHGIQQRLRKMGTIVGSYATVASLLYELETIEGMAGVMLTFDDFVLGMKAFGEHIQLLMKSRRHVQVA